MESLNIVFTGKDQVETRRESTPILKPNEVLIETKCALISTGTEGIVLARNFAPGTSWDAWVKYPFYPGYSNTGVIVEVGSEVKDLRVGQRVASRAAHRQYAAVDAEYVYSVPDAISDEAACWVAFASIVQHGVRRPKIEMGETVIVIGLGLLGQLAVQYARLSGAGEVIAIDTEPMRREMAASHGATKVIAAGVEDAQPLVEELTNGAMADVVFDVTGHAPVFAHALKLLRRFGRLVILGDTGTPGEQRLTHDVINKDLQILGAHDTNPPEASSDYARWSRAAMIDLFWKYLEREQMRVEDLISHSFAPEDAETAYNLLKTHRGTAMGVLFDFRSTENKP